MRGVKVEFVVQKFGEIPLEPDAAEVFSALKAEGSKIALISSGLPTFVVEKLASIVGADYAAGVEVGIKDEALTGEAWGDVIERNGKFLVLKRLMDDKKITPSECIVIADDRNNSSIFLRDALKIGYNPDFLIRIKADDVVDGKFAGILPVVNQQLKVKRLPSKKEILRELIHGSGVFIPVLAILFGVPIVAASICVVLALYSVSEFARIRGEKLPFFSTVTRRAASQSELSQVAFAPIYFALGILLTLILIKAPSSSAAIAIFCLGDSTASIIGGRFSKKGLPFNRAKTLEGTLGGFFFAFLGGALFIAPWMALIGAAVGMFVEFLPLPVNDNLTIPLVTGFVLLLLAGVR